MKSSFPAKPINSHLKLTHLTNVDLANHVSRFKHWLKLQFLRFSLVSCFFFLFFPNSQTNSLTQTKEADTQYDDILNSGIVTGGQILSLAGNIMATFPEESDGSDHLVANDIVPKLLIKIFMKVHPQYNNTDDVIFQIRNGTLDI